ncbi:MAG TPA: methyltransferase domain-containing protein [Terriglobales bacterium]|jgi:SAM-dependent methyltransferase|nr:methyltransferase domain-containing protein [Terriglobales bacterium]
MIRSRRHPLISNVLASSILSWILWSPLNGLLQAQELSKLPYVPTPQIVVDEMLKLAKVAAGDHVIDLGSGDGRMIITAARNFKASGLGVDIDGKLVELANQQAKAAGVADRARFVEQDMFKTDVGPATVVTLYVMPDFMEKLRPKLLSELKPGARIVAHDYYMDGWYPDDRLILTVPEKVAANGTDKAYIYLWIVPAVAAGDWRMDFDFGSGKPELVVLSFNQQYQMLNAVGAVKAGPLKVDNPTLKGNEINFSVPVGSNNYRFTGRIQGDRMEGTAVASLGSKAVPWRATRLPPDKK